MTAATEIAEVVCRLQNRSLAVCENCGGEGYTDMNTSACGVCFGAGVTTPEMLARLKLAGSTEAALHTIAEGITTTFDEQEGCDVEVWLDAEEMQEIARGALELFGLPA